MSLRAALSSVRLTRLPALPQPTVMRLAQELDAKETEGPLPEANLDDVARGFVSSAERREPPSARDWKHVPWCLWTTTPAVAENDVALALLLDRIASRLSRRLFRVLATVYLTQFGLHRPHIARVAAVLAARASDVDDKWARLHEQCHSFDLEEAPDRLATAALANRTNPVQHLKSLEIGGIAAGGGLAIEAMREGLHMIAGTPTASVATRIEVIRSFCVIPDNALVLPEAKPDVARGLVLPFKNVPLAITERDTLLDFINKLFKDPRIHPENWIGMNDAEVVVRGWLTEQSLRQFFDVVDRVAPPHQWQYRRAFWTAVFEAGLIRSAWVVFDPAGAAVAMKAFGDAASFGRFTGGAVQPGHSVLIMRIGNSVIADWSHNGRCNIWESANESGAPQLNMSLYRRSDVRKALPGSMGELASNRLGVYTHASAESGLWQRRVAKHLRTITGVLVPPEAYDVF
jgi:hypothetical protein